MTERTKKELLRDLANANMRLHAVTEEHEKYATLTAILDDRGIHSIVMLQDQYSAEIITNALLVAVYALPEWNVVNSFGHRDTGDRRAIITSDGEVKEI